MKKRAPKNTRGALAIIVSRPQAVSLLGVSTRSYDRLEAEGIVSPLTPRRGTRGSSYDGAAVVRAYLAYRERKLGGGGESPRDRRDRSQAELNELRLARERRQLLPREAVVSEGRAYIGAVQAKLRALTPRAVQKGIIPGKSGVKLSAIVEEAVDEMAAWRTSLELLDAEDDG